MTNMKRITIAVPGELDERVLQLRKNDRFVRCSYAEIVRQLLRLGMKKLIDEGGNK